jgi:hypothetical protein
MNEKHKYLRESIENGSKPVINNKGSVAFLKTETIKLNLTFQLNVKNNFF